MKITKRQLRKLIKEELEGIQEVGGYFPDPDKEKLAFEAAIQQANRTLGEEKVKAIFNELMNTPDVKLP
tara:strand:- start:50 stop:256 length:207 start_codon:yes stop_codon:yes gene_type:complete